MSQDRPDVDGSSNPFSGFRSYADGTPRPAEERFGSLGLQTEQPPGAPPARRRPAWRRPAIAAACVAAGLGGLLLARPLVTDAPPVPGGPQMEVQVNAPPAPPVAPPPAPSARLEVLPPGSPPAAVAAAPSVSPRPAEPPTERIEAPAPAEAAATPETLGASADVADIRPPPPRPELHPCAHASSLAEEMVCRDARLAEADRRMKLAYAAALDAGVPEEPLRLEQQDWLEIRELAAQTSRRSVVNIYRQRIAELRAMADGGY